MQEETKIKWENIEGFKPAYEEQINNWNQKLNGIYNEKLAIFNKDDIPDTKEDWKKIKLIIVADNPGKKEAEQKRYLVGGAGEIARGFFRIAYNDLKINMEGDVLLLNKTPIYSSNTNSLKNIYNDNKGREILNDTQDWMAKKIYELHQILECDLWIIGSGNFEKFFEKFKETLNNVYKENEKWERVFVFKHFSYGWFFRDFEKFEYDGILKECLKQKGIENREFFFGR